MATSGAEIQIENGNFTRVHNDIWNALSRAPLTSTEFRCLMFLFRETYGWQRKETTVSMGAWAKAIGLDRRAVIRAVQHMLSCNVIRRTDNGSHRPATWGFNKYFEQWDFTQTSDNSVTSASDNDDTSLASTSDNSVTKTSDNSVTQYKERKKVAAATAADVPEPMPPRNPFVAAYERYIGVVESHIAAERIADWEKRISLGAWQYAVKEAHDNNARNWKYLTAILQRVEREGAPVQDAAQDSKPKAPEYGYISDPLTGEKKRVQL